MLHGVAERCSRDLPCLRIDRREQESETATTHDLWPNVGQVAPSRQMVRGLHGLHELRPDKTIRVSRTTDPHRQQPFEAGRILGAVEIRSGVVVRLNGADCFDAIIGGHVAAELPLAVEIVDEFAGFPLLLGARDVFAGLRLMRLVLV